MQSSTKRKGSAVRSSTRGAQPAPTPARLARQLAGFFRYASLCSDSDFLREVSELDLTLSQLKVLSLLAEQPDELSVKELAEQLGISLPAASRAVDPLVRRKLVARNEDTDDRRVKRVRTTQRGDRLAKRLAETRVASFEKVLAEFSQAEQRKLGAALDALLERPEISVYYPSERSSR